MWDPYAALGYELKNGVQRNLERLVTRGCRSVGNQLIRAAMGLTLVPAVLLKAGKLLGAEIPYP